MFSALSDLDRQPPTDYMNAHNVDCMHSKSLKLRLLNEEQRQISPNKMTSLTSQSSLYVVSNLQV